MWDFLFSEAIEEDGSLVDESEDDIETVSDNDFIDDAEINESVEGHYAFTNVNRNYADAVYDSFSDFDFDQELNNYCNENEVCNLSVVEFKDHKNKLSNLLTRWLTLTIWIIKIRFSIWFCIL